MWHPQVLQLSALKAEGLDRFWQAVSSFRELQTANGRLQARRHRQALAWMWDSLHAGLRHRFTQHPAVAAQLGRITREVEAGTLPASTAARQLLTLFSPEPPVSH